MRLADLAGWVGAATLVVAYAAASAGSLPTESRRAQLLNLVGSVGLGVVAASHRAWPSLTLNGRVARPRPSGPDPLAR
jgi:hypothetical protein